MHSFKKNLVFILILCLSLGQAAQPLSAAKKTIKIKVKKSQILEKGLDALKKQLKEEIEKAEKAKKAAEEAQKKAEEETRQADQAKKKADEAKKIQEEAEKKAEKEKKEAEKKKTEEEKKQAEEAIKRALEAKKKTEEAKRLAEDAKEQKEEQEKLAEQEKKKAEDSKKKAEDMLKLLAEKQRELEAQKKTEKIEKKELPTIIQGNVKNQAGGASVAGALVSMGNQQVTSDGNGNYTLSILLQTSEDKSYVVFNVSKDGFSSYSRSFWVNVGENNIQDFDLTSNLALIQGIVKDKASNAAIVGATVKIGDKETVTDANGKYSLNVPISEVSQNGQAWFWVLVSKEGYTGINYGIWALPGQTTAHDFSLNNNLSLVQGIVKDKASNAAIVGASIKIGDKEAVTDASGKYSLNVPISEVSQNGQAWIWVLVSKEGYTGVNYGIWVLPGQTTIHDFTLSGNLALIQGFVKEEGTETPIVGATVKIGDDNQAITDANGKYSLSVPVAHVPENGQLWFWATITKEGYSGKTFGFMATVGQITNNDFKLQSVLVTVQGVVKDEGTQVPIVGVTLKIGEKEAVTDANGKYSFSLPLGQDAQNGQSGFWAVITKEGYTGKNIYFWAALGQITNLNITLQSNVAMIQGIVKDKGTNAPIAGATVKIGEKETVSDANGKYNMSVPLTQVSQEGQAWVWATITKEGYAALNIYFMAMAGQTTNRDFELQNMVATIQGMVKDQSTLAAIVGVAVQSGDVQTVTSAYGKYILNIPVSQVTDGNAWIVISLIKEGYVQQSIWFWTPVGQAMNKDFTMKSNQATIKGVVKAESGAILDGAKVKIGEQTVFADSNGQYSITVPVPSNGGGYWMNVTKEGYIPLNFYKAVTEAGELNQDLTLKSNTMIISGLVRDKTTQAGISGATVQGTGKSAATNAGGIYTLSLTFGSESENGWINVIKEGYKPFNLFMNFSAGGVKTQNFDLEIDESKSVKTKLAISGNVYVVEDGGKKVPVSKAKITYEGPANGTVETDSEGKYMISGNLVLGTYSLYVSESEVGVTNKKSVPLKDQNMILDFLIPDSEIDVDVEVKE